MDLALTSTSDGGFRLGPQSAIGMLWLQTHFEIEHWPLLAAGQIQVDGSSADLLCEDARAAGLLVCRTPILPVSIQSSN